MSPSPDPRPNPFPGLTRLLDAAARDPDLLPPRARRLAEAILASPPPDGAERPVWDRVRRELRLTGRRVSRFVRRAPQQMAVLDALEAAGWPPEGITNPFGTSAAARRRLRNAVWHLGQKAPGVRVRTDGERAWWEPAGGPAQVSATKRK